MKLSKYAIVSIFFLFSSPIICSWTDFFKKEKTVTLTEKNRRDCNQLGQFWEAFCKQPNSNYAVLYHIINLYNYQPFTLKILECIQKNGLLSTAELEKRNIRGIFNFRKKLYSDEGIIMPKDEFNHVYFTTRAIFNGNQKIVFGRTIRMLVRKKDYRIHNMSYRFSKEHILGLPEHKDPYFIHSVSLKNYTSNDFTSPEIIIPDSVAPEQLIFEYPNTLHKKIITQKAEEYRKKITDSEKTKKSLPKNSRNSIKSN